MRAIGQRVVQGGSRYSAPTLIDDTLLATLRSLIPLDTEHLPQAIQVIECLRHAYPCVPQVACFDTAFHRRLPPVAQMYALPRHLRDAGLMRYGFVDYAHHVMQCMVEAAEAFSHRLPELFAGLDRSKELPFPVRYPTACSPQAWAAASPLLMLRTMLRFDPDVRRGCLYLSPEVPEWMGKLVLDGVPLGGGKLRIEVEGNTITRLDKPDTRKIESQNAT